jgi:MFS superfamily sulfate permease-like transporter
MPEPGLAGGVPTKRRFAKGISMGTILIVILLLVLLGAWPAWPYRRGWGYYPSSTVGLLLAVVLVLALPGRI